jgi:hypothetical protein
MKQALKLVTLIALGAGLNTSALVAADTETTATLLSTIQRQDLVNRQPADAFEISFGSLNGGRASLLSKDSSANGAAGFASWYAANSRTFLSWTGGVVGANIVESDDFIRYYGPNESFETRQGDSLTSIFSNSQDNEALAFITYSFGGSVTEVGLFTFNTNWSNPSDPNFGATGLFDVFTLSAGNVSAVYGSADPAANDGYGVLSTSSVPEPSSMSLMLFGATALVALRRLRKNV